jgi:pyruvate carboxylase
MVSVTPATRECTQFIVDGNHIYHRARDNAIYDFSKKAVENGLDIFRVFDSLNYFGAFGRFG